MDTIYADLKGKTVYITGGASGVGAGFVEAFCGQSCTVIFTDIDKVAGESLHGDMLTKFGHKVQFEHLDVTDISNLQSSIEKASVTYGKIDVLVNNVANDLRHNALDINLKKWRDLMAVNMDAAFFASQAVIKTMTKTGGGTIINLSSINGRMAPVGMPAYVVAKSGIEALTKALAKEYGEFGIRVNAIAPGWIATEKQLKLWFKPQVEKEWNKQLAMSHRRIYPKDVAKLALFLASNDSEMITGQTIVIDAGRV